MSAGSAIIHGIAADLKNRGYVPAANRFVGTNRKEETMPSRPDTTKKYLQNQLDKAQARKAALDAEIAGLKNAIEALESKA